jgi:hypothetical protein
VSFNPFSPASRRITIVITCDVSKFITLLIQNLDGKVYKGLMDTAAYIKDTGLEMCGKTVNTWDNKPAFKSSTEVSGDHATIVIGTDNPIYRFVDLGTQARIIEARNKKTLAFQSEYKARTSPGSLESGEKIRSGDFVHPKIVYNYPGIAARRFLETIAAYLGKAGKTYLESAIFYRIHQP